MSRTSDPGYKVEGFTYQKEGHTFKGYSHMEGQPNWCHNTMIGGNEKRSFEWLTWCLRWLMLKWLARINLIQRCTLRRDAWTKGQFFLGSCTPWCRQYGKGVMVVFKKGLRLRRWFLLQLWPSGDSLEGMVPSGWSKYLNLNPVWITLCWDVVSRVNSCFLNLILMS